MTNNTPHRQKESEANQPLQSFSQSYSFGQENNGRRQSKKQLDLEGIRELILEMRI